MTSEKKAEPVALPDFLEGHWFTEEGKMIAREYAAKERRDLAYGHLSDLEMANYLFMAGRNDLNLVGYQTGAKERIRWLSAKLAIAEARIAALTSEKATAHV